MRNPLDVNNNLQIEAAISDIQLFGSKDQIESLNYILDNPVDLGHGVKGLAYDTILNKLRKSLREEIKLEPIEGNIRWFRLGTEGFSKEQLDSIYSTILKEQNELVNPKGQ